MTGLPQDIIPGNTRTLGANGNIDAQLTFDVCCILGRWHTGFEAIVSSHQNSLHTWFPVVNPSRLSRAISQLTINPCAELAVLILHIFLINPKIPDSVREHSESSMSLYSTCRALFEQLQETRGECTATIQAGLLLAVYEQGRGFLSASYTTLATCAKLWLASGLQYQYTHCYSPPTLNEIECMWWAIYTLERLQRLASREPQRPPLVFEAPFTSKPFIVHDDSSGQAIASR